jgi:hypothetical protein
MNSPLVGLFAYGLAGLFLIYYDGVAYLQNNEIL